MAERAEYIVVVDGIEHTMLLSEAAAARHGARRAEEATPTRGGGKQRQPANKGRTPKNKAVDKEKDDGAPAADPH